MTKKDITTDDSMSRDIYTGETELTEMGNPGNEMGNPGNEMENLRNEMENLKNEMGNLRNEMGNLRNEMGNTRRRMSRLRDGIGCRRYGLLLATLLLVVATPLFATGDEEAAYAPALTSIQLGQSTLKLMGYGQSSYAVTRSGGKSENALTMQRFILMADARITKEISFWLMYDFSTGKMHEYYAQYAFSPALKVRVGQYKQPFTMESLLPPTLISNINMDESVAYMAGIAGDPCFGIGRVGRDMGVMLTGDLWIKEGRPRVNYSIGVFNGAGMNQKENNNQKDIIGQLNFMLWKKTTFSGSFILGTAQAQAPSPFNCFAQGDNYRRNRFSIGADHKNRVLNFRSEAMWGNDGGAKSMGWYANAEFHLTGKLDLVANYDYLKRNRDIDATATHNWIGGLQYWLYKQCCIRSQYVFKNRKSGEISRSWVTQFQIAF